MKGILEGGLLPKSVPGLSTSTKNLLSAKFIESLKLYGDLEEVRDQQDYELSVPFEYSEMMQDVPEHIE